MIKNTDLEEVLGRMPANENQPTPLAPFGSDIARLNALATQNAGAELGKLGAEMRDRYLTSKNLAERTK